MKNTTLEITADIRELVGKNIDQTERAFGYFFRAAKAPLPSTGELALDIAHRNVTLALEFARKLANANDMQEVIALQAEYLRTQVEQASQFMRELTPRG